MEISEECDLLVERWETGDVAVIYDNQWVWSADRVWVCMLIMHSLPGHRELLRGDRGHAIPGARNCEGDILAQIAPIHSSTSYL